MKCNRLVTLGDLVLAVHWCWFPFVKCICVIVWYSGAVMGWCIPPVPWCATEQLGRCCILGGRLHGETQAPCGDAWLLPNCYQAIITIATCGKQYEPTRGNSSAGLLLWNKCRSLYLCPSVSGLQQVRHHLMLCKWLAHQSSSKYCAL